MSKTIAFTVALLLASRALLPAQEIGLRGERFGGDLINDVDQATVAMHAVTPFLESSSMLLADIDLEKIDVDATAKWVSELIGTTTSGDDAKTLQGFIDSLKGGGVSHVYISAASRSLIDGGPVVIVPCQNPAVVNGLATVAIQQAPDPSSQKVHVGDKVVVAGAARAIDRIVAREGFNRPDLILPLKSAERLDHALVISLPGEAREELAALWPEHLALAPLPTPISPRQIVSDVQRVVVSLRLPPEPEMKVRIETIDASAAERITDLIDNVLSLAGELKSMIEVNVDVANVNLHATPETFFRLASTIAAPARARATQMQKSNDMKQVMLAFHNYHSSEKHLPPRAFTDSQGRPLLSWRVAILPYLEQAAMYRAVKLDQPWDSEDNRMISSTLIPTYGGDRSMGSKTTIRAPVFPGSAWDGNGPPKTFRDIHDGLSNTIAIIDAPASAAIEWANPQPWEISVDDPMSDIFGDRQTVMVGMFDGAVITLARETMTNEKLKAMLTISGAR